MQNYLKICALLAVALLMFPFSVSAMDVQISNIKITKTPDDLMLSLAVEGAFNENLEEAVSNGIPATFSFIITLDKKRDFWPDERISEQTLTHTLKYHNLKNHYIIKKSWQNNKALMTTSFDEAKKIMSEINGLKLIALKNLKPGTHYQINAKAELDKIRLPFILKYVLFFVSLWDFETEWHSYEFVY